MTDKFNGSKYRVPIVCLSLFIVVIVSYLPVLHNDFINFDDTGYVTNNRHVQAGIGKDSIHWAFTSGHLANWHPVTWFSHMLDWAFFNLNPGGHHWSSLTIHLVNTLLLFGVLRQITGTFWRSAVVAVLFGLHPLHVESVAWISERKDVLSTMFWMLTMWAYGRFLIERKRIYYLLLIVFFVLGLMSKPMLVTLPFVLLLLDFWPLKRFQSNHQDNFDVTLMLPLVREKWPVFLLSAASCGVTFFVQHVGGAVKSITAFPISHRIANVLMAYVDYLKKMALPIKLALFYPHVHIAFLYTAMALLILTALTAIVVCSRKRYPFLMTGWFWYLGTLLPVAGLIQVGHQRMADRYTYIPLIGIFIILAWGGEVIMSRWRIKKWFAATIVGVIIITLGMITHKQVSRWRNSATIWAHTIRVTAPNCRAHYYFGQAFQKKEEIEKAMAQYEKALEICPDFDLAHNNLGGIKYYQGDRESAEYHFLQALRTNPYLSSANNNMGVMLMSRERIDKATEYFAKALQDDSENIDALNNLAGVLSNSGKIQQAIDCYQRVINIDPTQVSAQYNLGRLLTKQKKFYVALGHFAEAIKLSPEHDNAHNESGIILAKIGLFQKSRLFFEKALDLNPKNSGARKNLKLLEGFTHLKSGKKEKKKPR